MFELEQKPGTNFFYVNDGNGGRVVTCVPDGFAVPVRDTEGIVMPVAVTVIGQHSGHAEAFGYTISDASEINDGITIRAIQFYKIQE